MVNTSQWVGVLKRTIKLMGCLVIDVSREYLGAEVPLTVLSERVEPRFAALIIPLSYSAIPDMLFEVLFLPLVKSMKNTL